MRNIHAYSLKRDGNTYLAKNFQVHEFRCTDGTDPVFVAELLPVVLQAIRGIVGKAVGISSAYRTPGHNEKVEGEEYSQHLYGLAADIYVEGMAPKELAKVARKVMPDWGGVGIYTSQGFVHVDVREKKADWGS